MPKDATPTQKKLTCSRKACILLFLAAFCGLMLVAVLQWPLNGYLYFGGKGSLGKVFPHQRVTFELAVLEHLFFLGVSLYAFWFVLNLKVDLPSEGQGGAEG
jgi:hypothetical protein